MKINLDKKIINYIYLGILLSIALFFLFYNLGASSLQDWDEGVYALISNEVSRQNGLTMFLNNQPIFEKPPLGYLFEAFFIKTVGFTELGIRLASSFFLLGSILLIFFLGKKLWNEHVGFAGAVLTLISPALLHQHMARSGDLDSGLLFFTLLAFYFLVLSEKNPKLFWLSGLAAGLGIMLRGSSGVFIIIISLVYLLVSKKWRNFRWQDYLWYLICILLVVLPWHVYEYLFYGQDFIRVYLSEHLFGRVVAPLQNHPGPWFYYFKYFIDTMGLMFWLAVVAFFYACYNWFKKNDQAISLIIVWLVVTLPALMIMQTKLYWYAITLIPALYFLIVYFIYSIRKNRVLAGLIILFCLIVNILYLKKDIQLVLTPQISPVQATADYLFSQEDQRPLNLVVYNVLAWEKGRILPSAQYYLELKNNGQTYLIAENNLEHYIDRDQYSYFLTDEPGLIDLRAKGGDKYDFKISFQNGNLLLVEKTLK